MEFRIVELSERLSDGSVMYQVFKDGTSVLGYRDYNEAMQLVYTTPVQDDDAVIEEYIGAIATRTGEKFKTDYELAAGWLAAAEGE